MDDAEVRKEQETAIQSQETNLVGLVEPDSDFSESQKAVQVVGLNKNGGIQARII